MSSFGLEGGEHWKGGRLAGIGFPSFAGPNGRCWIRTSDLLLVRQAL